MHGNLMVWLSLVYRGQWALFHGSDAGTLRTRSVDLVLVNEPCKPCKPCKPYKVSVVSLDHQHADPPELPTLRFCWTVRCEVPSALGSPMDTD